MMPPSFSHDAEPALSQEPYGEWNSTFDAIAATGGVTLLLGGVDVGKTTFARQMVERALQAGRRVALIDADLGQSEIGPPACVGLALVEKALPALSDLPPHALAFIGSSSPVGHLLEYVSAIRRLADLAQSQLEAGRTTAMPVPDSETPPSPEADTARPLLLVDTSGYVQGPGARRLYQTLFDLLSPAHVIGLQRHAELAPILAPMRKRAGCILHTPPVPAVIGKKPPSFRAQRRTMKFSAYFREAEQHTYAFDDVALVGTWLGTGTPVAAHLLKFLEQTLKSRARVYYAELSGRSLGLMVSQAIPPDALQLALAQEELKAQSLSVTVAPRLKHLLLGLEGANGKLLGLGLLEAIDFRRRTLGVLTPVRAPGAATVLHFGSLRISPNGSEVGSLRLGELG